MGLPIEACQPKGHGAEGSMVQDGQALNMILMDMQAIECIEGLGSNLLKGDSDAIFALYAARFFQLASAGHIQDAIAFGRDQDESHCKGQGGEDTAAEGELLSKHLS